MRKSKADQTVEGIYIVLSNISKGIAFLHQSVNIGNSMICSVKKKKFWIIHKEWLILPRLKKLSKFTSNWID